jgi:hypothetical protein
LIDAGATPADCVLAALAGGAAPIRPAAVAALARLTPAGPVELPLALVRLPDAVAAATDVDPLWLAAVDRSRRDARAAVVASGREAALEAALHLAILSGTERLDPADDADDDAHVASGACLWLLTAAVASAMSGAVPDPFGPWARLVTGGWWPEGPSGGRLIVAALGPSLPGVGVRRGSGG